MKLGVKRLFDVMLWVILGFFRSFLIQKSNFLLEHAILSHLKWLILLFKKILFIAPPLSKRQNSNLTSSPDKKKIKLADKLLEMESIDLELCAYNWC